MIRYATSILRKIGKLHHFPGVLFLLASSLLLVAVGFVITDHIGVASKVINVFWGVVLFGTVLYTLEVLKYEN